MSKLHFLNDGPENRTLDFDEDIVYLGRSSENDIQINDKHISRTHLKVTRLRGKYFIEDLGSGNGTYISGRLIPPNRGCEVNPGDPIRIGNTIFSIDERYGNDTPFFLSPTAASDCRNSTAEIDRPWTPAKNFELIYKVSSALMQSLDINETLENILGHVFDLMKRIERGAILLIDHRTGKITDVISRSQNEIKDISPSYSRSVVNKVFRERKPVVVYDTVEEKGCDCSESMEVMRVRSVLCVPLISRSRVRGALYLDSLSRPHGFRKDDVDLLTILCGPAATAIENAMLYRTLRDDVQDKSKLLSETRNRLSKSESYTKALFDNMKSGVIVYGSVHGDDDFIILDLNKAAQRIEKVRKKAVLGKSAVKVWPWIKDTGLLTALRETARTNQSTYKIVSLLTAECEKVFRDFHLYNLPSGEMVAIYDDITEKVRAEEEHRALREHLFAAQKMESIGVLAGGIAHNFRNILQSIRGNIEYLQVEQCDPADMRDILERVDGCVERAVDLINNLLQFSKKGGRFEAVDLDLSEVITETHELVNRLFGREIKFRLDLQEGLFVRGNRSILSQVFFNLFTNAKDAMPEGGVLSVETLRKENEAIALVTDTGCGMDEEVLKRIFDPFFTLKEVGQGTGLGLSTCLGIIEQHKGSITVSSTPGEGSTFKISLPLSLSKQNDDVACNRVLKRGNGQKILIVEDEEPTLVALSKLVKTLNYEAIPCKDLIQALEKSDSLQPDLVLLDRNMPELDGVTCMKKILKKHRKTKFVIISGYEDSAPQAIDEETRALIRGYLVKPSSIDELSEILNQALAS